MRVGPSKNQFFGEVRQALLVSGTTFFGKELLATIAFG
jgi:hypothetical protein